MNPSWIHLGGSFQTRLYHPALAGTPPEEGNWNHLGGLFPTPLYHGSAELAERPCFKISDIRHSQIIRSGETHPCVAGNSDLIRVSFTRFGQGLSRAETSCPLVDCFDITLFPAASSFSPLRHSSPRRHSSESSPAWMQVVERRLEQAAEESRRADRGVRRIARLTLAGITRAWSFPPGGNGLSKPLDSGLRRNDGGAGVRHWSGVAEGLSGW